jgi:hypothetical protein
MTLHGFQFGHRGQSPGRRQAARVRLALPAKVILITGHEPCQLDDLSQTGACVTVAGTPPPIGDDAVLMVNGLEAFGTVVWRRETSFGLCFEEPVAMDEVVRLRGFHDHYRTLEQQQQRNRARDFVQGRRV